MKTNPLAAAFREAIHAQPDNDTPRLVFADWLEEHGDSARAEFIRVQCAKARLPRWHRDYSRLAWRERVLLARHGHIWREELPTLKGMEWGAFERGFIGEVRLDTTDTLRNNVEAISAAAPIRRATMETWGNDEWTDGVSFLTGMRLCDGGDHLYEEPDCIFQSPLLSTLKTLDLSELNVEGEHFAALGRSEQLANLETLILDDCYMGGGNLRPFVESATFRNLTALSMKGNAGGYHDDARIRPADIALLTRSPHLSKLRSLDVSGNEIDGPALFDLLESPHLGDLRELTLSRNRIAADGIARLFGVRTTTRLHRLALDRNPIGDGGVQLLADAEFCAELRSLDLDTCEIKAKGVRLLAEAPWFDSLEQLNLNHNSAGAEGVFALTKGCPSGNLNALHLRDNELDAEATALLAGAPGLRGLQTLDLSENTLEDDALKALASSLHWTQLHELHLEHCKWNGASMEALRRAAWLPSLFQLALSGNPIGDEMLSRLLADGGLARIHQLTLRSCEFSRDVAAFLADADLIELHWLDLTGNALGDSGVEDLADSALAASLVELDLGDNNVGDAGARSLASRAWPLLTKLGLERDNLTDKGALALAAAREMPRLREIPCGYNRIEWKTFRQLGPRFRQY